MTRRYTVTVENTSITAASDLLQIKQSASNGKMVEVIRWWWRPTDNTLATAQVLSTRCRLMPATVSDGSGGSTPTVVANDGGDSGAGFTVLANNTSKATTNGTARVYDEAGAHIYNGYDQQPEYPVTVKNGESFVFELLSASIQGTIHLSWGAEIDEIG